MTEKIVGYVLIVFGILVILYSVFDIYSVLTGKKASIDPFKLEGISLDLSSFVGGAEEQQAIKNSGKSLKSEIISPDVLNKPLNYVFHLLLAGFILNVGYKVASLGVLLVRPVKVSLKSQGFLPEKKDI